MPSIIGNIELFKISNRDISTSSSVYNLLLGTNQNPSGFKFLCFGPAKFDGNFTADLTSSTGYLTSNLVGLLQNTQLQNNSITLDSIDLTLGSTFSQLALDGTNFSNVLADTVKINTVNDNVEYYLSFVDDSGTNKSLNIDKVGTFRYNPNLNMLSVNNINADIYKINNSQISSENILYETGNTQLLKAKIDAGVSNTNNNSNNITTLASAISLAQTAINNNTTNIALKEPIIILSTIATYYRGDKTFQPLTKSVILLGNVDNTSDLLKPISNSTQSAINLKQDIITDTSDISMNSIETKTNLTLRVKNSNNTDYNNVIKWQNSGSTSTIALARRYVSGVSSNGANFTIQIGKESNIIDLPVAFVVRENRNVNIGSSQTTTDKFNVEGNSNIEGNLNLTSGNLYKINSLQIDSSDILYESGNTQLLKAKIDDKQRTISFTSTCGLTMSVNNGENLKVDMTKANTETSFDDDELMLIQKTNGNLAKITKQQLVSSLPTSNTYTGGENVNIDSSNEITLTTDLTNISSVRSSGSTLGLYIGSSSIATFGSSEITFTKVVNCQQPVVLYSNLYGNVQPYVSAYSSNFNNPIPYIKTTASVPTKAGQRDFAATDNVGGSTSAQFTYNPVQKQIRLGHNSNVYTGIGPGNIGSAFLWTGNNNTGLDTTSTTYTYGFAFHYAATDGNFYLMKRNNSFTSDYVFRVKRSNAQVKFYVVPTGISDDRIKFNEKRIENALDVLMKLSPETYNRLININKDTVSSFPIINPNPKDLKKESGFIAQEIEDIPELKYMVDTDDTGLKSIQYQDLISWSIAGIQELNNKNIVLENKVKDLENEVELLKFQMKTIYEKLKI